MGLGGMKYAWQRQTKDFAHTKGDQYSSLITDNRGIGESDKPRFRYSTSEMAKDIIEVVDHLGWTSKRELHIIGISMGGMIAQEMVRPPNFRFFDCSHDASFDVQEVLLETFRNCTIRLMYAHLPWAFPEPLFHPVISVASLDPAPLHPAPRLHPFVAARASFIGPHASYLTVDRHAS
jgi:pimeloyl-ACP methyl ester carboxylesterase